MGSPDSAANQSATGAAKPGTLNRVGVASAWEKQLVCQRLPGHSADGDRGDAFISFPRSGAAADPHKLFYPPGTPGARVRVADAEMAPGLHLDLDSFGLDSRALGGVTMLRLALLFLV